MTDAAASAEFAPWEDPAAKPLIRFQSVTKRFGDFTAIDSIDLDIFEKEFFALLGPSGCGKTTLMRMLGGFEIPTEGVIELDGQDIGPVPGNTMTIYYNWPAIGGLGMTGRRIRNSNQNRHGLVIFLDWDRVGNSDMCRSWVQAKLIKRWHVSTGCCLPASL